jgi:hypothetical protein
MTDIDTLCKRVDDLCKEIDEAAALHKARHSRHTTIAEHFSDDPELGSDDYEDVSNPSADADDDSDGADDGDDGNDLEDDDEDDGISKLGGAPHLYQREEAAGYAQSNEAANRPGSLKHTSHPEKRNTIVQATRPARRHAFDDKIDFVKDRDGVTKSVAMQRARLEFPDTWQAYQASLAGSSAQEQYAARAGRGTTVGKRAPSLIEAEMMKGCSREVAAQRVAQQHGFRAFDQSTSIRKRADLTYEFQSRVDEIMRKDRVDACEATRRARQEDWELYAAMQRAG